MFGIKKLITVNEGINRARRDENAVLLDIRPREDYKAGHVAGTINIPLNKIEQVKNRIRSFDTTIYVIGTYTYRPKKGVSQLKKMGYKNVIPSGYMEEHIGQLTKR